MQANKPYFSTGLPHIFAIVSSQNFHYDETNQRHLGARNNQSEISPCDVSFLSSLSIIHVTTHRKMTKKRSIFVKTYSTKYNEGKYIRQSRNYK